MELEQIIPYESDLLDTFVGQVNIVREVRKLIQTSKRSGSPFMNILLSADSGMGKTRLARSIAREVGSAIKYLEVGIGITQPEFSELMTSMQRGDFLLLEDIDQMEEPIASMLVDVLKKDEFEIVISPTEKPIIPVRPFTLIGLTRRLMDVDERMRAMMRLYQFKPYENYEVRRVIQDRAERLGFHLSASGATLIADRGDQNPDQALFSLKKVLSFLGPDFTREISLGDVHDIFDPEEPSIQQFSVEDTITRLRQMSGHEFEEFVDRMFTEVGLHVENTGGAGDQGIDLVVHSPSGDVGIQCKQQDGTIGPDVIRNLSGGLKLNNLTMGSVITTSTFSAQAVDQGKELNVDCLDKSWLLAFIKHHYIDASAL